MSRWGWKYVGGSYCKYIWIKVRKRGGKSRLWEAGWVVSHIKGGAGVCGWIASHIYLNWTSGKENKKAMRSWMSHVIHERRQKCVGEPHKKTKFSWLVLAIQKKKVSCLVLAIQKRVTHPHTSSSFYVCGVATISSLLKSQGLFRKSVLLKRRYSAKETCNLKVPTNRSHPIT